MVGVEQFDGENKGKVFLFALSTCIWCRKTKNLLDSLGVKYSYIFMDKLEGKEKDKRMDELENWNPRCSFPTLVINNKKVIVGFKEDEIKKEIGK